MMAKLTTAGRNKIAGKNFAGPGRSYPVEDKNHARAALSMVSKYGSPSVKSEVRAKVHAKYPSISKEVEKRLSKRDR
jgi:hypothetical protein